MTNFVTIERDDVTPAQLFELLHDMLLRLDALEFNVACLSLLVLHEHGVLEAPSGKAVQETLEAIRTWLNDYERQRQAVETDRQFLQAPE